MTDATLPLSRPVAWSSDLAEQILQQLALGRSLSRICRDHRMPKHSIVQHWGTTDHDGFAARYDRACAAGRDCRAGFVPYSAETADRILAQLSIGRTLAQICRDDGMPGRRSVQRWVIADRGGFEARYLEACIRGHAIAGGPVFYSAEIAEQILDELSNGLTLSEVCRNPGMPTPAAVLKWVHLDRDGFAQRYNVARAIGYQAMFDRILDLADDSRDDSIIRYNAAGDRERVPNHENIQRARLRCNQLRWLLAKALPRLQDAANDDTGEDRLDRLMRDIEERKRQFPSSKA